MKKQKVFSIVSTLVLCVCLMMYISDTVKLHAAGKSKDIDAFQQNKLIGRGINYGNALEFPGSSSWVETLDFDYAKMIKDIGFDSVRIPICPMRQAAVYPPYTIAPEFLKRIDAAVDHALSCGLAVIIDHHEYRLMAENAESKREKFLATWIQLSERYKDYPSNVFFEVLNEPNGDIEPIWNELMKEAIDIIRKTNPTRTLIVGPVNWNQIDYLEQLELPENDRNIIVTIHSYSPGEFTHQGASWSNHRDKSNVKWGSDEDKAAVVRDFDKAAAWSKAHNRPLHLGEFGAYEKADMESRVRWTDFVTRTAEARGISFSYWEFCAGFGIYDRQEKELIYPLLNALIPPE